MGVVVRKSSTVVVRPPPEPVTATVNINLSPLDKNVMSVPAAVFMVFDGRIPEPAATIERALSQALAHYLPISGRLAPGAEQGEFHIRCTGEGVPFVAAAADCPLKDAEFFGRSAAGALLEELAIYYPAEHCGFGDPLLMMQVTEFSCGGFVVGVTWNHVLADAAGIGQFLQAVGELTRGLPSPSVAPVRWDDALTAVPPPTDGFVELMMTLQPAGMAALDVTVPWGLINRIKNNSDARGSSRPPCTTFEAVTALLWQCRTRAVGLSSSPEEPVALYFAVNARRYVGSRRGYYGNCVTGRVVVATAGAVAGGDLADLVGMIQRAKSQIPEQFDHGGEKGAGVDRRGVAGLAVDGYNVLIVTSWRNLGLDRADFGGGPPARVTTYGRGRARAPNCVPCPGSGALGSSVREEHAAAFLGELASRSK
ncbi:acyl transferase 15-like [Triticum dicoccoides]|uniref:acyl transferase 15-like n=1 Tax=Triticum dicoccoides TaxID=85692 RepID=UPI00188E26E7|nr:acyl transferase 15-like [Triticum dicoccoides]